MICQGELTFKTQRLCKFEHVCSNCVDSFVKEQPDFCHSVCSLLGWVLDLEGVDVELCCVCPPRNNNAQMVAKDVKIGNITITLEDNDLNKSDINGVYASVYLPYDFDDEGIIDLPEMDGK
jgi:hypothetical protein